MVSRRVTHIKVGSSYRKAFIGSSMTQNKPNLTESSQLESLRSIAISDVKYLVHTGHTKKPLQFLRTVKKHRQFIISSQTFIHV